MSEPENVDRSASDEWIEAWGEEVQRSSNRSRMYAEIAKRKASEAAQLNQQTRRLLRSIVIATALVLVLEFAIAAITLGGTR